ncbi:hypothetical protein TNCV_4103551 [Trichonephila clavipes]|nr:hypothetical protein TNCV_4103551 [Trichonephila clavipes]
MNNSDELIEDGLEYSDDDGDSYLICMSSNEDPDSECENNIGSKNTIQSIKKSDDENKLDRNISVRKREREHVPSMHKRKSGPDSALKIGCRENKAEYFFKEIPTC